MVGLEERPIDSELRLAPPAETLAAALGPTGALRRHAVAAPAPPARTLAAALGPTGALRRHAVAALAPDSFTWQSLTREGVGDGEAAQAMASAVAGA